MLPRSKLLAATAMTGLALATATTAMADNALMGKTNHEDIMLTGDIVAVYGDNFALDYGDGLVTVELDDWDYFDEADRLIVGDTVTVHGEVDADFYQEPTVEASSVYSYDRSTFYYASDADGQDIDMRIYSFVAPAPEGTWFGLTGTVQDIEGSEFVLDTGLNHISVETAHLENNPMDDEGHQKINVGDAVYVSGRLDKHVFDENEINANRVVSLNTKKTPGDIGN